ncbi:MAG: tyrosine-type recombinase/integrase [Gammaproteobacteria bacterium]|nr:tyrosine-type recombinase/integrase [Gammaproteobacteria bacterium]
MLTDAQIRKLRCPPNESVVRHNFGNGLRLYVRPSGLKTWFLEYKHEGKDKIWKIGIYGMYPDLSLADASRIRDDSKSLRLKGIDPKAHYEAQKEAASVVLKGKPTLRLVIETYLSKESINHKGHKWNFNRLEKFKREYPDICDTAVDEVTPLQLIEWRDDRLEFVKSASVSREHNLLSSVFTYAIKEMQLLPENPFSKVKKPKTSIPRQRRVSREEVEIICNACGYVQGTAPQNKKQQVAWCFIFAILTAMRASEISGITWNNVNFIKRFIHLPDTKNGSSRNVPLLDEAVKHIKLMQGFDDLRMVTIDADSLSTMFRKVRDSTQLKEADLRFHDSRHEACTQLAKILQIQDLAKVSGHKDLKILLNVYYNITAEELADKMNGGSLNNVVQFAKIA